MDDIRQYWLNSGLNSASELMVALLQCGMDEDAEKVMEIADELVDKGARS